MPGLSFKMLLIKATFFYYWKFKVSQQNNANLKRVKDSLKIILEKHILFYPF